MQILLIFLIFVFSHHLHAAEFKIIAASVPPLLEQNGEGIDGLSGVYGKIVADKIRKAGKIKEFEVTWVPWKRALFEVKKTKNGVFFPLARMPERDKEFVWLGHLGKVESWFYATNPKIKLESNSDLKKYRIGFMNGSMREAELKKILGEKATNLDGLTEDIDNHRKLIFDRIDIWVTQTEVFENADAIYRKKNPDSPRVYAIKKFIDQDIWLVSGHDMPKEQQSKIRELFKEP